MHRALTTTVAAALLCSTGCANLWDAVTSRRFRDAPYKTVKQAIVPEDPMIVLRADPPRTGDERAKAIHRLKEPLHNNGTQEEQDFLIDMLAQTATTDNSPVLRYAAIEALGHFVDPRAVMILMSAYQKADGQPDAALHPPKPGDSPVVQIGGLSAGRAPIRPGLDPKLLTGPTGFAPDTVSALRCRCLESLGSTHKSEAAQFLAAAAGADRSDLIPVGSDNVEVRQAAVRGLGQCRQPEAVTALAKVLQNEAGKDPILIRSAHQGLVRLTGKKLPPDPQKWNEVVQAGVTIAPEPTWIENVIQNAAFWEK